MVSAMAHTVPTDTTLCYSDDPEELRELQGVFGSTDLQDHYAARALCEDCWFFYQCRSLAADLSKTVGWAGAPEGTWGGVLYQRGKRVAGGARVRSAS